MHIRLINQNIHLSLLLLAVVETIGFFCATLLAALARFDWSYAKVQYEIGPVIFIGAWFSAITLISAIAMGLYQVRQRARLRGVFIRVIASVLISTTSLLTVFYFFTGLRLGRGVIAWNVFFALAISVAIRMLFHSLMDRALFKRRVLIVGTGKQASCFTRLRRRTDQRGYRVIGFVRVESEGSSQLPPARVLGDVSNLVALVKANAIDEIVIAMDERRETFPTKALLECRLSGVQITTLVSFLERETYRVRVDLLTPSWIVFADGFRHSFLKNAIDRVFDIALSLLVLTLALPVIVLTFLAIKLEDGLRAPVFYSQLRVGLDNRPFRILKFRSMRVDAEANGAVWASQNDPRVTRVGAWLRSLRIDELPQVFNVLAGHMRFTGPRPERPEFVSQLSAAIPYYRERHSVKPGITGWAQLCYSYGASAEDAMEKLQYDLYYVKNSNLLFDIGIVLQTLEVILWRKGSR